MVEIVIILRNKEYFISKTVEIYVQNPKFRKPHHIGKNGLGKCAKIWLLDPPG